MPAYYNELDPYAAQWLRNLIATQLITAGEVDERPIQDVRPADLTQFTRCHFFAGIAGWDIALQQANYPIDKQVWTGSCPCQPFSTAGKRKQFTDERHLWPFWFHLISVCRPPVILGEQVANGSGLWFDLVLADLESADYAVGAAVLPAAGIGAPHIRDRVWFVADSNSQRQYGLPGDAEVAAVSQPVSDSLGGELWQQSGWSGGPNGTSSLLARESSEDVANPDIERLEGRDGSELRQRAGERFARTGGSSNVADSDEQSLGWTAESRQKHNHWDVEPSLGRVVDGFPTRAQRLRAYGNAIVPQVAAEFIKAYLACRP